MRPEIIKIEANHPDQALIARAATILKEGGVIAYPTETFYGLGAQAGNAAAVERVFAIKGRAGGNPIALIASGEEEIDRLAADIPLAARRLMQTFWPGPLTLLFSAAADLNPRLTAGTGKIGLRISSHPIAADLAKTLGQAITATSANLSGEEACVTAAQVRERLGSQLDAIIDGGQTRGTAGSTILDVTSDPPFCLREGAIPYSRITTALNKE